MDPKKPRSVFAFPLPTAVAYARAVAVRGSEGALTRDVFVREAREILADSRPAVPSAFLEALSLPLGDLPRASGEPLRAKLLESLPGLYRAASPLEVRGFKMRRLDAQAQAALRAADESLSTALRYLLEDTREAFPVWWMALTHAEASIRLSAVSRLPAAGCALSPLLPLFATDSVVAVRQAARAALGFKPKHSWGAVTRGMQRQSSLLLQIASADASTPEGLALLDRSSMDHRTGVRCAVALRLPDDSPLWARLARDGAKRVRVAAAQRVALDSVEARLLLKDASQAVRTAIGRRVLASEEGLAAPPLESPEAVRDALTGAASAQRRAAWKALAGEEA